MSRHSGPKSPGQRQRALIDRAGALAEGLALAARQAADRREKTARLRKLREDRDLAAKKD
ncbi:MAG: hypothetical protein HXY23_09120 [Parvularculaceae bacterium]|nr:hypothetical protein [Parvularculaceae bacterium]